MTATNQNRLDIEVTQSRFSDIEVPEILRTQVGTGWSTIDFLFAGKGIRPSTVGMITGVPGAGKTTLSLQLAASLAIQGHTVVYNTCEESLYQLMFKIEEMGYDTALASGWASNYHEVGEILSHAEERRLATPPGKHMFLFVDSLDTISRAPEPGARGRPLSEQAQHIMATWDIAEWCKSKFAIAQIIVQSTKDGDMAGSQKIKHAIDTLLCLDVCTERTDPEHYEKRYAVQKKNRFGITGQRQWYSITDGGIKFESDNAIAVKTVKTTVATTDSANSQGLTVDEEHPHLNAEEQEEDDQWILGSSASD